MTLENIYYISQTIAVFAILGSLAAIYFQQRQANKIARRDISQRVSSSYGDSVRELMVNPELAATFRKVMFEQAELSPLEATQILTYFNLTVAAHHDAYLAYREGLVDARMMEGLDRNTASYLTAPTFEREWRRIQRLGIYQREFCDHVHARVREFYPDTPATLSAIEASRA